MTKLSFGTHPFLLGFEQLERLVERTAKSSEGYPPFNIEATAENAYRITLAVAGFREDDLQITVEDRQLVVRGRQAEEAGGMAGILELEAGGLVDRHGDGARGRVRPPPRMQGDGLRVRRIHHVALLLPASGGALMPHPFHAGGGWRKAGCNLPW